MYQLISWLSNNCKRYYSNYSVRVSSMRVGIRKNWKSKSFCFWFVRKWINEPISFRYTVFPKDYTGNADLHGNYNGVVGQLQRQEVDFSTFLAITKSRIRVAQFVRTIEPDQISVISLKPLLLSQHLALVRPFTGKFLDILCTFRLIFVLIQYSIVYSRKSIELQDTQLSLQWRCG